MEKDMVKAITQEFINEAIDAPRLLADMASMEKYLTESYGGRAFIELLQNADDAGATQIKLYQKDNKIYCFNNGRVFSESDLLSICRSGSSDKSRGRFIGYRGVGFKSTTYLAKHILVTSGDIMFEFSLKRCAKELSLENEEKIPIVRVPFLVEELSNDVEIEIKKAFEDGYKTGFVFYDTKANSMKNEIEEVSNGYFLFLNNITNCEININGVKKKMYNINRKKDIITIDGDKYESWQIIHGSNNHDVQIACLLDINNYIIECNNNDAVFHCYLPTIDKTGFPFKVNADFTTDPSRKHLSQDDINRNLLKESAKIILEIVSNVGLCNLYSGFIDLLIGGGQSFARIPLIFKDEIDKLIKNTRWVRLFSGKYVTPIEYKKKFYWLEQSEYTLLKKNFINIKEQCIDNSMYDNDSIERYIYKYSEETYTISDLLEILTSKSFSKVNPNIQGKLFANFIKEIRLKNEAKKFLSSISQCLIPLKNGSSVKLQDIDEDKWSDIHVDFVTSLLQYIYNSDLEWIDSLLDTNMIQVQAVKHLIIQDEVKTIQSNRTVKSIKPQISKWRSAEQKCMELENNFGNTATDVSKQNVGYDVESITKDGSKRYIEVKSLSNIGSPFSMTNNEYTAAHQYGDEYYLCLLAQTDEMLTAIYIKNPLNKLQLEKRVRQWEWYCDEYSGTQYSIDLK